MSSAPEPSPAETLVEHARRLGAAVAVEDADQLLAYLDAMLQTNEHVNLTGVRDWDQAVVLHALDSLAFGKAGVEPHHVLDIGTGNGFPGVGVAALFPRATVLLIDRTGKKVRAIGMCLVTAGLDRVETRQLDAQQAPALHKELRHAFDVATARAVGQPAQMAELAEPLVRPGGHLVLWLDADAETPERLGKFRLARVVEYDLPEPAARHRKLGVYQRAR
ncbi:MAG: class I SAM-dependent methyltransferase [Planctomycetes bacterium]|nr:class I SAM-dependent methyltransferase [Planctomycetota bacterium]